MSAVPSQLGFFDSPPPDLAKARAQRRANVAQNIDHGLVVEVPIARNDHPETSHEAADQLTRSGARASMQRTILAHVKRFPGCIYLEIAGATGIERHNVASRLAELKGSTPPFVRQGEKREITIGGQRRRYVTWWAAQ